MEPTKNSIGFASISLKEEGAPIHPDELTYEHETAYCDICKANYDRQLAAYNAHQASKSK